MFDAADEGSEPLGWWSSSANLDDKAGTDFSCFWAFAGAANAGGEPLDRLKP